MRTQTETSTKNMLLKSTRLPLAADAKMSADTINQKISIDIRSRQTLAIPRREQSLDKCQPHLVAPDALVPVDEVLADHELVGVHHVQQLPAKFIVGRAGSSGSVCSTVNLKQPWTKCTGTGIPS